MRGTGPGGLDLRVDAVSPKTIATRLREVCATPDTLEASRARTPPERLGFGDDCAGALLFLASPRSGGYASGQVIEVDGGQLVP